MKKARGSRKNSVFHNIRKADKSVSLQNGNNAHNTCDNRSEDCCQSRTVDSQSGETKVSVDQQIIKNDVDCVGSHIGTHRDLGVAGASLGGIDAHLDTVEDHAAHNDSEICYRTVMCFRRGAAHPYDRTCQSHEQDAEKHGRSKNKKHGSAEDAVGFLGVFFAAPPGDQCRNGYIQRKEQRQADKFGLCRESYSGHSIGTEGADHQRIHQAGKGCKE